MKNKGPYSVLVLLLMVILTDLVTVSTASSSIQDSSPASGAVTPPVESGWKLGDAVSFNNLKIFPVISDRAVPMSLMTLDEGLRSGKVLVRERGSDGRLRRIRRGSSDDADVNELSVINRSGKTLLLIAGEIVFGGKQDRIVAHDCLVASTGRPVTIDVFCVEKNRWEEQPSFGRNRPIDNTRADSGRQTARGARNKGGHGPVGFALLADMASPNVREKAVVTKDQSKVWSEVDRTNSQNYVSPETGRLGAVFEDKHVDRKLSDYERAFRGLVRHPRVVGAVVAVGGKLRSADVFLSNSLFAKYWPKLLRSSGLEAMNIQAGIQEDVDLEAARKFLSRVVGERASDSRRRVYNLVEHKSEDHASFELILPDDKAPKLIHFNRFTKQD